MKQKGLEKFQQSFRFITGLLRAPLRFGLLATQETGVAAGFIPIAIGTSHPWRVFW